MTVQVLSDRNGNDRIQMRSNRSAMPGQMLSDRSDQTHMQRNRSGDAWAVPERRECLW